MTLEDIEKAHLREAQIRRLRREINDLRDNTLPSKVRSIEVNGEIQYTSGGRSSLPSSPVESHFRSLERLEEKLADAEQLQRLFWEMAETIEDDEIRAIIYWRVSRQLTWTKISDKLYGLAAAVTTPYMRLRRWIDRNGE